MSFRPEYIRPVIQNKATRVVTAAHSTHNNPLNNFNLASLEVAENEIIRALRPAALRCGLNKSDICSTINGDMRAGKQASSRRCIGERPTCSVERGHQGVRPEPLNDLRQDESGEIEWTKINARRLIKVRSLLRLLGVA
jgi:hypothetical protein